jgi:hypothetical protein
VVNGVERGEAPATASEAAAATRQLVTLTAPAWNWPGLTRLADAREVVDTLTELAASLRPVCAQLAEYVDHLGGGQGSWHLDSPTPEPIAEAAARLNAAALAAELLEDSFRLCARGLNALGDDTTH